MSVSALQLRVQHLVHTAPLGWALRCQLGKGDRFILPGGALMALVGRGCGRRVARR